MKTNQYKKIITAAAVIPMCLSLTACVDFTSALITGAIVGGISGTASLVHSYATKENLSSEITYKHLGNVTANLQTTEQYSTCFKKTPVVSNKTDSGSFSPREVKTIKFPVHTINTTFINTNTASSIISFRIKPELHYYVEFNDAKKYNVYTLQNGVRKDVPVVLRIRNLKNGRCLPMTSEEEKKLSA